MKALPYALLPLMLLGACEKKASPQAQRPPQEVGVITLAAQPAEIVTELPGRTAAWRMAEVRPQVSGIILERMFTEGADVKAGEQLYQIDPATYKAAYASSVASVAKADAAVTVSQLLSDRRKKLVSSRVISAQDYDDAFASLQQAKADAAAARAALEADRINLEYTKVLSPISGRIGRSAVTEGALVTAGQAGALAIVQQLDPIYVDITQSSTQLLRLQRELAAGQLKGTDASEPSVRLLHEDGTEYPESGKLQFSEVAVDQGTGSVTLRAVFPNPRGQLLPGMFVRAFVKEGVKDDAILVPQKGVARNPRGQPTALVVGEGNKVELRTLKTDRVLGENWLVTEGLKPGDRLIVEGLQKIAPGAPVNPVEIETVKVAATQAAKSEK